MPQYAPKDTFDNPHADKVTPVAPVTQDSPQEEDTSYTKSSRVKNGRGKNNGKSFKVDKPWLDWE